MVLAMRIWGRHSLFVYKDLHPDLQLLVTRIRDEVCDISLSSGYRGPDAQNELFQSGRSTLDWPDSKHNKRPSHAVDLHPYPYPEKDLKLWAGLAWIAGNANQIAMQEGFAIRWGGDWDGDGDLTDQNFDDLFHLELL